MCHGVLFLCQRMSRLFCSNLPDRDTAVLVRHTAMAMFFKILPSNCLLFVIPMCALCIETAPKKSEHACDDLHGYSGESQKARCVDDPHRQNGPSEKVVKSSRGDAVPIDGEKVDHRELGAFSLEI